MRELQSLDSQVIDGLSIVGTERHYKKVYARYWRENVVPSAEYRKKRRQRVAATLRGRLV